MLPILVLAFAVGISGNPIPANQTCIRPLFSVVGNHYDPPKLCSLTSSMVLDKHNLRQKYFEILNDIQSQPDVQKINEILDELDTLMTDRSLINAVKCSACKTGIKMYKFLKRVGVKKETLLTVFENLCVDFHISTKKICQGTLNLYGKVLATLIDETKTSEGGMCSIFLNSKCGDNLLENEWKVGLSETSKPPVTKPKLPPNSAPKLTVLHITDSHWDTKYQEGSWAECDEPLCCRQENILPDNTATRAGKFGGWKCDAPEETFDSMLKHIKETHPNIDYIIWTGDIPAHDIWMQTREDNLDVLNKTVNKLFTTFPNMPLYPAIGNHESVPSNLFPEGNNTVNPMDWLYSVVNEKWKTWLPESASTTVRKGAFYTTLIRPGFRIVSMNMNYCYTFNWWLIENPVDPLKELQWLIELLEKAEKNNEKVHIIGHVPPGSTDCLRAWQLNYYKIMNRFEGTVTAQFFGHTHADEFELFYDLKNTSRPFGVSYVGPSVTTYTYHNPSYRIYQVEGDYNNTGRFVLDHETWYLDLEKANSENKAEWKKLYSAKEAYNMTSLFPEDWHDLYLRVKNSDVTLQLYHKYYWNDSPKRPVCDERCRQNRLCEIRSCVVYGEP